MRRNAALVAGHRGDVGGRLDPEHGHARPLEVLQQVAVVARDLDDEAAGAEACARRRATEASASAWRSIDAEYDEK